MFDAFTVTYLVDHLVELFFVVFHHGVISALINDLRNLFGIGDSILSHDVSEVLQIKGIESPHESDQDNGCGKGELCD